jgi:nucleotide-binding universal stress UspA family protein
MPVWSVFPYVRYLAQYFGSELHLLGISTKPQEALDQSLKSYLDNLTLKLKEDNIPVKAEFIYGNPAVETVKYAHKNGITLVATAAGKNNEITCTILSNIEKRMGVNTSTPLLLVPPGRYKETDILASLSITKILVPMDCAQAGEAVLPYINTLARRLNSSVTLLHVNSPPPRAVPVLHSEVVSTSRAVGRDYLQKVNQHFQSQGIVTSSEVIDGLPAKTILKYAKQNNFDLIAMATRYSCGIGDWLFGNTTNKVVEKTEIPILTMSYPANDSISTAV